MPNIFKANIAKVVNKALGTLVFDQVLTKAVKTEDPTNSTKIVTVETPHDCKGFIDEFKDEWVNGTTVKVNDRKIVILGDSLPIGVVPEPGDKITAEGAMAPATAGIRSNCYAQIAVLRKDLSLCEQLETSSIRDICRGGIIQMKILSDCDPFETDVYKWTCTIQVAAEQNDLNICDQIEGQGAYKAEALDRSPDLWRVCWADGDIESSSRRPR